MGRNCSGKESGNETTCNYVKQAVGGFKLLFRNLTTIVFGLKPIFVSGWNYSRATGLAFCCSLSVYTLEPNALSGRWTIFLLYRPLGSLEYHFVITLSILFIGSTVRCYTKAKFFKHSSTANGMLHSTLSRVICIHNILHAPSLIYLNRPIPPTESYPFL